MDHIDEYELMDALSASLEGEFDVLGFLGRRNEATLVYLARSLTKGSLVVLIATNATDPATQEPAFLLDVKDNLDASVPDVESRCPKCNAKLRQWARFCTQCRADVSGISASTGEPHSRQELLEAVRAQAGSEYEVLGDMPRAEGGGLVYFAREPTTGRIVALRLNREDQHEYSLNVTRVLKPVPEHQAGKRPTGPISITRQQDEELRQYLRELRQQRKQERAATGGGSSAAGTASGGKAPLDRRLVTAGAVIIVLLLALLLAIAG